MAVVKFVGTRADVTRIALQLSAMLTGREADTHGVARGFMLSLGFSALSDIKDAFVTKANGGTDELGVKWAPLSPVTIANRFVGKRDRESSALIHTRELIRERETKKALERFLVSLPKAEAKRRAKIVGGLKATKETGRTKVETLGGRRVKILRDTGVLLTSVSPGVLTGSGSSLMYSRPTGEGGSEQIFKFGGGEVIVGTNVKYAATHQYGDAKRKIPARPFLPDDIPAVWWDRWLKAANKALVVSAELLYRRTS